MRAVATFLFVSVLTVISRAEVIRTTPREVAHNDWISGTYWSEYVIPIDSSRLVFDCKIKIDTSKWSTDGTEGFWFAWGFGEVVEETGHIDLGMCEYRHVAKDSEHFDFHKMPHCHDRTWDGHENYTDDYQMGGFFPLNFESNIDDKGILTMDIEMSKEYTAQLGSSDHHIHDGAKMEITFMDGTIKNDVAVFKKDQMYMKQLNITLDPLAE
jgi:hypothetical protein